MRRGLQVSLVVLAALLPKTVAALECIEYDIRTAYHEYAGKPESYTLVFGRLDGFRRAIPADSAQPYLYVARFTGFGASRRAFDRAFQTEVTIDFSELRLTGETGMDPASAEELTVGTGLVWLKHTDKGYGATYSLCWPIVDTDPASVKSALRCLRGGYCPKS
jgi:hypothetical protein